MSNEVVISNKSKSIFNLFSEVMDFKDLVYYMCRREFVGSYKQSILGVLWFFVQPISLCIVYYFLFSKVANLSTGELPPLLFYLSGIICWTLFAESITATSNCFDANAALFTKVFFPRLISPISSITTILTKASAQLVILVVFILFLNFSKNLGLGLNFLKVLTSLSSLTFMALGLGLTIASISIKYKDFKFILNYLIQLLMYGTTVVYPYSSLGDNYKKFMFFNPVSHLIEFLRSSIVQGYYYETNGVWCGVIFSLVVFVFGVKRFSSVEKDFVDKI